MTAFEDRAFREVAVAGAPVRGGHVDTQRDPGMHAHAGNDHVKTQREGHHLQAKAGATEETKPIDTLILDF